jgi:hypothetical protein
VRVLLGLLDVLDRDQPLQVAAAVDDQQLLDPVLVQELLGPLQRRPLGDGDELLGHHRVDWLVQVALEADVAVGEDADRPTVAAYHRQPRDAVPLHELDGGGQLLIRSDGDRVDDHPGLGPS